MVASFSRHREYPKRTLIRCFLTNSVAGGAAILFFYMALSFNWAVLPAALAGALSLYILFFTPFVIVDSRRVRVVPYFSKPRFWHRDVRLWKRDLEVFLVSRSIRQGQGNCAPRSILLGR